MTADPTARLLVAALTKQGGAIAVAESLTGGLLAASLVDVPGASKVFRGGVVAYATELKARLLGVDEGLLAQHGPVDAEVARQMAIGVRHRLGPAALGVATTGVAGPDAQDGHPVGTVFIGISTDTGAQAHRLALSGDRDAIRRTSVFEALRRALAAVGE